MQSTIAYVGSLAASGTKTITLPFAQTPTEIAVRLTVNFVGAVGANSKVSLATKVSPDGSTFNATSQAALSTPVQGAVDTPQSVLGVVQKASQPGSDVAGAIEAVQFVLTNSDSANAATFAITVETLLA